MATTKDAVQFSFIVVFLITVVSPCLGSFVSTTRTAPVYSIHSSEHRNVALSMSLKPAAIPLMDSGKALARSGELLIDATSQMNIYGGGLSAAGAQIRNAGDCVAQAAASCRFKTAAELVCDELRESATCLLEASGKLKLAVEEANADKNKELAQRIEPMVQPMATCSNELESAGAGIMMRQAVADIGNHLVTCGENLETLSDAVSAMAPNIKDAETSGQRLAYAAESMINAGKCLQGPPPKPKGKAWLKG